MTPDHLLRAVQRKTQIKISLRSDQDLMMHKFRITLEPLQSLMSIETFIRQPV